MIERLVYLPPAERVSALASTSRCSKTEILTLWVHRYWQFRPMLPGLRVQIVITLSYQPDAVAQLRRPLDVGHLSGSGLLRTKFASIAITAAIFGQSDSGHSAVRVASDAATIGAPTLSVHFKRVSRSCRHTHGPLTSMRVTPCSTDGAHVTQLRRAPLPCYTRR